MKIVIELDMQPYDQVSDDPNVTFFEALDVVNKAAILLARDLPMPATVQKVWVER